LKKRKKKGAIIFDYDGVLNIGTAELIQLMISIAGNLNLKTPSIQDLQLLWGMGWQELHARMAHDLAWSNSDLKKFEERLNAVDKSNYNYKAAGLDDFLTKAKQEYLLFILSNRLRESFEICSTITEFNQSYFNKIMTKNDQDYCKPDPTSLWSIMEIITQNSIKQSDVLYIGDTVKYDYQMILNSLLPIKFYAIISGGNSRQMSIEAGLSESRILKRLTALQL